MIPELISKAFEYMSQNGNGVAVGFALLAIAVLLGVYKYYLELTSRLQSKLEEKDATIISRDKQIVVLQTELQNCNETAKRTTEEHVDYHHSEREELTALVQEMVRLLAELKNFANTTYNDTRDVKSKLDSLQTMILLRGNSNAGQ